MIPVPPEAVAPNWVVSPEQSSSGKAVAETEVSELRVTVTFPEPEKVLFVITTE